MTNKHNMGLHPLFQVAENLLKETQTSFEKGFLKDLQKNCLIQVENFPVADTYIYYKDADKKEVEKISLKLYLSGYRKEDITIEANDADRTLTIKGEIKETNEHFPEGEHIQRLTQRASAKKFQTTYNINKYEVFKVVMNDGVLNIDLIPTKKSELKQIEIN